MIRIAKNSPIEREANEVKRKTEAAYKRVMRLERYFAKYRWQKGLKR